MSKKRVVIIVTIISLISTVSLWGWSMTLYSNRRAALPAFYSMGESPSFPKSLLYTKDCIQLDAVEPGEGCLESMPVLNSEREQLLAILCWASLLVLLASTTTVIALSLRSTIPRPTR